MSVSRVFRKDIQGLRGVAVGLVVLEHATPLLPGGYIGVDVFFVISGFVITQLLLREIESQGRISLADFYSRRVRRLIPGLVIVLMFSLVGSVFVLSPGLEQEKAVSGALASFFFVANIRYILESGYFFLESDPFRHLWSLGVEEQFYLFYPLLIGVLLKLSRVRRIQMAKLSLAVFGLLAVISFVLASALAEGIRILPLPTRMSFFGTPFRLWELMTGGMLAVLFFHREIRVGRFAQMSGQFIGLGLVLIPALVYDAFTVFPGVAALAPVVGTVILLGIGSAGVNSESPLTLKPLTFLGDISYGLYLWHWPMIVFTERLFPENPLAVFLAVTISLCVSTVQLRSVEIPFRNRSEVVGRKALTFFGRASIAVVLLSALVLGISRTGLGLDSRAQFEPMPRISDGCSFESGDTVFGTNCMYETEGKLRMLLIGDSQAGALANAFVSVAKELGASYKIVYGNSCPVHVRPNELRKSCRDLNEQLPRLVAGFRPTIIVVANASDLYVTRGGFGKPDTQIRQADGSLPRNYSEALQNWVSGVSEALQSDWRGSTPLLYVQMIPIAPIRAESLFTRGDRLERFSLKDGFDRNIVVARERAELSNLSQVAIFDPADVLCARHQCKLASNGKSIYADAYHLNSRGAELLVPRMLEVIQAISGK